MKNILLTCVIVFFIYAIFWLCVYKKRSVSVGDFYSFTLDTDEIENPFKQPEIDTIEIVAIKDGFVQWRYLDVGYKNGFIQSSKLWWINRTDCIIEKLKP